jgi:putative peptidoglycan lipid II flippase
MTNPGEPPDLTSETPAASVPVSAPSRVSGDRAAGMVAAGIMVSRVVGLLRTWAIARYLGAGVAMDAYSAAVKIPNLVRTLLGEGAISASFIPVYSAAVERGDQRAARALAGALLGILLAAVSVLTIVGILLAPALVSIVAGGFDAETEALTIRLTRVMFPMTGLMVISGWCLAIQNSHRRFFMSYASAALWSIAQIVLLFGWGTTTADGAGGPLFGIGSRVGNPIELAWWLAWATLVGALLQIGAQLPQVISLVRPMRISLDRHAPGIDRTLRNFVPVVVALSAVQISSFIDTRIASQLPTAALSSINYAAQLYTLPVSLFGLSVAAASLPDFSRDTLHATDILRDRLRSGWVRILFYIIPSTVVLIVFGDLVVTLLLRSGRFGQEETELVHWVLAAYAIGLTGYASIKLLASAHYAFNDYRTPLRASVLAIVTSAVLALALALPFRDSVRAAAGIALGSALGSYVNLALLTAGLRRRLGPLYTRDMWTGTLRIVGATALATTVAFGVRVGLEQADVIRATWRPYATAIGTLLAFGGIFLIAAYAAGSQEAARWLRTFRVVRRKPS